MNKINGEGFLFYMETLNSVTEVTKWAKDNLDAYPPAFIMDVLFQEVICDRMRDSGGDTCPIVISEHQLNKKELALISPLTEDSVAEDTYWLTEEYSKEIYVYDDFGNAVTIYFKHKEEV